MLQERERSNIKIIHGIPDDASLILYTARVIFDDMLGNKDEEKLSCCSLEKDIAETLLWCTSHKIYFSKV